MNNNVVYCTTFPNINDLIYIFATINSNDNVNILYYNQIILKCRQLIFEISEVIACPQFDQIYGIHIVVTEDFYKTGVLHKYLKKHSLQSGSVQTVQRTLYENCCLYTITSKLTPKWNPVKDYFVYGRNFLTNQSLTDSVQLKLSINDKGNTTMSFNIKRIKMSVITLHNLYLTDDEITELYTNQYICFKEYSSKTIQVLPSMKRGKIVAIHLKLHNRTSLKTYQEMRRYWKNTYGYRLPENDEDIFYVDVSFYNGSHIFTYPNLCVKSYDPNCATHIDPLQIIQNFIIDLNKRVPTLLGKNYPVPSHFTDDLLPVTQLSENTSIKEITDENVDSIERTSNNNQNKAEPKSKLSQLLEELNKVEHKSVIYLTQQPEKTDVKRKENIHSKTISEDLKKQLEFLTNSISQRATTETHSNIVDNNPIQLKRSFGASTNVCDENGKVSQKKKRKFLFKSFQVNRVV